MLCYQPVYQRNPICVEDGMVGIQVNYSWLLFYPLAAGIRNQPYDLSNPLKKGLRPGDGEAFDSGVGSLKW
jgi:hypothetical protein